MLNLALIVVIGLAFLVVVRRLVKRIGCDCHTCGRRMSFFRELSLEQQNDILHYFRIQEKRDPDTSPIFVCSQCLMVYDDFSGEKKSMSGDVRSFCKICSSPSVWYLGDAVSTGEVAGFREANPALVKEIECLRCNRKPKTSLDCVFCDTAAKPTGCRKCHTLYVWRQFEPSASSLSR